jgi:putative transposase
MTTREMATQYKMAQWAQNMQERTASGQSIRGYCEANGITRQVYFYWQRKLREAAAQQLGAPEPEQSQALVPNGWAAVRLAEEAAPEPASSLTLRVGGAEIEVRHGFDEALLASVCRALTPHPNEPTVRRGPRSC